MIALLAAAVLLLAQKKPPPPPPPANAALEVDRLVTSGQAKLQKGDYTAAMADFNRALQIDARSAIAFSNRGLCQSGLKQYDKALTDFSKALEIDPRQTQAFIGRGDVHLGRRQFDDAITSYAKAIEVNPLHASAHALRGLAWISKGEYAQAKPDFERAIWLLKAPKDAVEFYQRGAAKHWTHDFAGAEADLGKAVEIHPANPTYLRTRGRNRIFMGKLKEAQDDLTKAVGVEPKEGSIGLELGDAYYLAGSWFEAIRAYKKAGESDPSVEDAGRLRSWRAQTRAGEKEAAVADLLDWMKKRKPAEEDGEFKRFSAFLAGTCTEEVFLEGIEGGDGRKILELRCRMYYDAGVKRLIAGDPATAKDYFRRAVETDVKDQIAHAFASAELKK